VLNEAKIGLDNYDPDFPRENISITESPTNFRTVQESTATQ